MKALFVVAEFTPLASSGGLGDAIAGLAHALGRRDIDVTVLLPRYQFLTDLGNVGPGVGPADSIYSFESEGVTLWLVDDPESFDRPGIYGPEPGAAYEDEWRRWGRFCQVAAAVGAAFDILHLHDAQTAGTALLSRRPTILTLHNAAYPVLGPAEEALGLFAEAANAAELLEWFGQANYLKAGVLAADQVTTVSQGYARQIAEDPAVSSGLNEHLASLLHPVVGIMNGIDTDRFDPATDLAIPEPFTSEDLSGRARARTGLLEASGLDGDGVIFGMVGRMTGQKGLELLDPILSGLVEEGMRLVAVGNGDEDQRVDAWVEDYPRVVWHAPYSEALARLVWAGSDSYLMPSLFEPGGLGNLYAMRYGAPPVVRATGGLATSVVDPKDDPAGANGFSFQDYDSDELAGTVRRAMATFRSEPASWAELQRHGMERNWGWDPSAGQYLALYNEVLQRRE
jgi:starch synthase